jgi:hypothetical protein
MSRSCAGGKLPFMEPLSRAVLWVAIAAWLLVAAAGLARLARLANRSQLRHQPHGAI